MLRDADLRDNFNSNSNANTNMNTNNTQQYDAPTSHHRQPSHHREYHYSRRRRDDAGSPPPIQVQGQGYSQAQAQSSSSHSHSHSAGHGAPPPPRIQQQASGSNSSSSHGHTHSQSHSHVHYHPAPPQIYYPAPTTSALPGPYPRDPRDPVTVSPLSTSPSRSRNASPFDPTPAMSTGDSNLSLAVNYIPSKFSNPRLSSLTTSSADHAPAVTFASGAAGPRRRRTGSRRREESLGPGVPKMGGGVEAFRSGEARIGGEGDEDEDGEEDGDGEEVDERGAGRGRKSWFAYSRTRNGARGRPGHPKARKARWNGFKWCLFIANLALTLYSLTALIFCLLTWFNVWAHADVIRAGNHTELALSTLAAASGIFTALIGWVGLLMNNRSFLAIYTFLLWVVFLLILVPGYMTYRRRTFNLEGKINAQWSKHLGESGRLRIQNQLQCCGYFSPFVEATVSQTCYARSTLPGCKASFLTFERHVLKVWYEVAFGLVPLHVAVVVAGLLCANHVTYRFGKGMMPKAYRLSVASMAVIMDNYAK
ncbi:hypothetical protein CVT26_007642 [Gymnopilus dilepis]|uniref:Tetraspanin Tsp2 n=1 Tax=Gymnopilus dilepis TaxID=231916 RepID=A0A409VZN9_9AGAR|nr:hypothetical protein CVT26_007642 [Gymnopilus dilepis]